MGLALAGVGCSSADDRATPVAEVATSPESPESGPPFLGQRFQRYFLFIGGDGQSPVAVLWTFRQSVVADGIRRVRSTHLGWQDQWETLLEDERMTPHNRFPWRILPGGGLQLRLAQGEEIRQIRIDLPSRQLELDRQEPLGDWSPDPSLNFQVYRARLTLPAAELEGFWIESTWTGLRTAIPGPREWGVLITQRGTPIVLLQEGDEHPAEGEGSSWLAWSIEQGQPRLMPPQTLRWSEVTPVDRARRNAPIGWQMVPDPEAAIRSMDGSIESRSLHLDVLPGDGPVFPIRVLHKVEGTLRWTDAPQSRPESFFGFLHHRQPLSVAP